jgi:HEPN domain-containing protein
VKRKDFQALAEARLRDAEILFRSRRFAGAYYLAGYAVECALKACVAKRTKRYDFPDKLIANEVYTHNLTRLLVPAGLRQIWQNELGTNGALDLKWSVVKDWTEESRYGKHTRKKAKDMLDAVGSPQGVLECLKKYW